MIDILLPALHAFRDLQKAAGGDGGGGGILQRAVCGLAEIHGNQIAVRGIYQEIVGYPLGTGQILRILRVNIAQGEAVKRPGLSSGPGGAVPVALSPVGADILARCRIKFHDMLCGAVRTDKALHRHVRVGRGDLQISGIFDLLIGPVQKRKVHHAVDDRPAGLLAVAPVIPGADEMSRRIETPRHIVRSQPRPVVGALISRQPVIDHRGGKPAEAAVVIHSLMIHETLIQLVLQLLCRFPVQLLSRGMIELPENAAPEAVRPPGGILFAHVVENPVFRRIGDLMTVPFHCRIHLRADPVIYPLQPFLFLDVYSNHTSPFRRRKAALKS